MPENSETKTVPFEEFSKVQQRLQETDERAKRFEAMATDYEKKFKGVDIDALRAEALEAKELRKKSAVGDEAKINELLEKERKELDGRYGGKLTELEQNLQERDKELNRYRVIHPALSKAAEVFNGDQLPLIEGVIERDCFYKDGKILVRGENGKPRPSVDNPREDMGLDEYIKTLAGKFPSSVKPSVRDGTGANGGRKTDGPITAGSVSVEQFKKMTPAEMNKIPPKERAELVKAALSTVNSF